MNWIDAAIVAALSLAAADVLVKLCSNRISGSLGVMLYGLGAFLVGLGWVAWDRWSGRPLRGTTGWATLAFVVGLVFSMVTLNMYLAYSRGAPISIASPVIRVGGLVMASLVGLFLLREPVTLRYGAGVLLAVVGVYLIATR